MSEKRHIPIEDMEFFQLFESCSDEAWKRVERWTPFERDTLGKQVVRAVDSIGFNLVEADGRYTAIDGLNRLIIARGSAREARLGIEKALRRGLIDEESANRLLLQITSALKQLNNFIGYRRKGIPRYEIREEAGEAYREQVEA